MKAGIIAVLVCTGLGNAAQAAPILKLAYSDMASPPYYLGDSDSVPAEPGPAVTLSQRAARQCGMVVQLSRWPGKRLTERLKLGEEDAVLMLSWTPERAGYAVYPMRGDAPDRDLRLVTLRYAFYVTRGSALQWDGSTLNGQTRPVGANLGWSVVSTLREHRIEVEEGNDTEQNFRKLRAGRIDAFAVQDHIGDRYLAANPNAGLMRLEPPLVNKDYFLVFSRNWFSRNPSLSACVWRTVAKLRETRLPALLGGKSQ